MYVVRTPAVPQWDTAGKSTNLPTYLSFESGLTNPKRTSKESKTSVLANRSPEYVF